MSSELMKLISANIESKIKQVKPFIVSDFDKGLVEGVSKQALHNVGILIGEGMVDCENAPMIDVQGVYLKENLKMKLEVLEKLWEKDKLDFNLATSFTIYSNRLKEVEAETNRPGYIGIYIIDSITHDEVVVKPEDVEFLKRLS